ncbi:serine protease [Deinococcus cavernae]|uniref:Serine protease n=1 Tax=Deinococcus cavernae TaxID=2320857 RepID=A0A418V5G7_9DEIO|nr:S1C family serine protease [Deinococcus cavernae]RJF71328.1 serine protease [Deinococcus cavernae]
MRRTSPWLPVLLTLALAAYLLPDWRGGTVTVPDTATGPDLTAPDSPPSTAQPGGSPPAAAHPNKPALPNELPPETLALFKQSRPATVQVKSLNPASNTGGLGTGFFINDAGDVLTAYHVVSDGQLFEVSTLEGRSLQARVKAFDAARDVALLEVRGKGPFPFLKLTTRAPRVGETVLAIGNSNGDYLQPRRGQLLALGVAAGRADFPQGTLEMTAPLEPGDSGGPIIDGNGQAIGVVSYIRQNLNGTTRSSYAVPVVEGNDLIQALRAGEKRDTPVVGLVLDPTHSGQTEPPGAVVLRVARNSPGERAGLRGCLADESGELTRLGDVVISVQGVSTPDANAFIQQVQRYQIGQTISLKYLRGGQQRETTLTLAAKRQVTDLNNDSIQSPCDSR